MLAWMYNLLLFAQEKAKPPAAAPKFDLSNYMIPIMLIIFMAVILFNPRKREEKKRAEKVNALKKNDRIVTIGGITGSVASVSEDRQYVTIKVEDNTRIKMLASSIHTVLSDESKDDSGDAAKS